MNSVILIGRLTRDPELRYLPGTGDALATFNLAVDRPYTKKDGEKQTDFINIQAWGKQGENVANYLKKGSRAAVKGSLQIRQYEKDGERRYASEIRADFVEFLDSKGEAKSNNTDTAAAGFNDQVDGFRAIDDDDVPF